MYMYRNHKYIFMYMKLCDYYCTCTSIIMYLHLLDHVFG
jgi:hypothetical protein